MSYIQSIEINKDLKNYKFYQGEENIISNIEKINIFIGSNNSGKSRLLRNIYLDKKIKYNMKTSELNDYNELVNNLNNEIQNTIENVHDKSGYRNIESRLEKREYLKEDIDYKKDFDEFMDHVKRSSVYESKFIVERDKEEAAERLEKIYDKYIKEFSDNKLDKFICKKSFKRIYIPILRGLRKLGDSEDILYRRTVNDYFYKDFIQGWESSNNLEIFTGQDLYKDVLGLLCGDFKGRQHLKEFEEFLGDNFFDKKQISLIPKIDSDVLYIKIGDEKEQPIYNLGDGIQSIIILTFKLFSNKGQDVLFFIEEPELYLHPGLQRKVLEIFSDEQFYTYQYFMTSHSNHLLDLTLDIKNISVFKFTKEIKPGEDEIFEKTANFIIENTNNDDMSVLELLGVNSSSIFQSNCTVWVEGITDRLYLRKYLEIYQKDKFSKKEIDKIYTEDLHYSFLEYSGGNITHWDFLDNAEGDLAPMNHERLFRKIFLIADSDGRNIDGSDEKSIRLRTLTEFFKERFYLLKAKEIENILQPHIIKNVVAKFKYKKKEDKSSELFNECEFNIEDYRNKNLGKFIDEKIKGKIDEKKLVDSSYDDLVVKSFTHGNTIARKVDFCKYSIEEIKGINDLSEDAIELCNRIYQFIKENNK